MSGEADDREGGRDRSMAGPDGWRLHAEGAAVHVEERAAVIADVHLGYEWARAARGDMAPPHSLAETQARLDRLLNDVAISRLIVAGDLVETAARCERTARDVGALRSWLAGRGVALQAVRGNHDPAPLPWSAAVGGWTIEHGHRPGTADRVVIGHFHPVLKAGGLVAPCFLVGADRIVLPAFSRNAAGLDVGAGGWPEGLRGRSRLRCVAGLDGVLLDFGPLETLPGRLVRLRAR